VTNPENPNSPAVIKNAQSAAEKVGLLIVPVEARSAQEIEDAFASVAKQSIAAVMVGLDATFFVQRERIVQLALRNRIASIHARIRGSRGTDELWGEFAGVLPPCRVVC